MATFTVRLDGSVQTSRTAVAASAFTSGPIKLAYTALEAAQSALTAVGSAPQHIKDQKTIDLHRAQEALNNAYTDYASGVTRWNLWIGFDPTIRAEGLGDWMNEIEGLKAKLDAYDAQHS